MKFSDIPQYTRDGNYTVDQSWVYLESWLDSNRNTETGMNLILEPEFQREHVWTEDQQKAYIMHVLRGGKSGRDIYFNCSTWMKGFSTDLVLVDGLQRVTAVRKFLNNEFFILDGFFYKDFSDTMRHTTACFTIHVNDLQTDMEVMQWYIEMNAGGTPHTEEEIDKVRKMMSDLDG